MLFSIFPSNTRLMISSTKASLLTSWKASIFVRYFYVLPIVTRLPCFYTSSRSLFFIIQEAALGRRRYLNIYAYYEIETYTRHIPWQKKKLITSSILSRDLITIYKPETKRRPDFVSHVSHALLILKFSRHVRVTHKSQQWRYHCGDTHYQPKRKMQYWLKTFWI